jgi:hypothetical protein
LYILFQLETVVLFFISCYMVFALLGNMTQLLAPLAPGSPTPVKQVTQKCTHHSLAWLL